MHALNLVWKVRLGLVALFVLLLAGLANHLQAAPSDLGCLVQRADYSVFNLETGVATKSPESIGWAARLYRRAAAYSPDGTRVAFADRPVDSTEKVKLRLKSLRVAEPVEGNVFYADAIAPVADVDLKWSPNGHWVSFRHDANGKEVIGLVNADDLSAQVLVSDAPQYSTSTSGLSDRYLALYSQVDNTVKVTLLAIPNLKTAWAGTFTGTCLICGKWSPNGQYIAYVLAPTIYESSPKRLFILRLDTQTQVSFDVPSISQWTPELLWSSDSQYLSLAEEMYRVGVYGVDGSAVREVAQLPVVQGYGWLSSDPIIKWAKDGSAIFYTHISNDTSNGNRQESYHTFAYYVKENRYLPLSVAKSTQSHLLLHPTKSYALVHWGENGKTYIGIVDVKNGRKTTLMEDLRPYSWDWGWIGDTAWVRLELPNRFLIAPIDATSPAIHTIEIAGETFRVNPYWGVGGPGGPYLHLDFASPDKRWVLLHTENKPVNHLWLVELATGKYRQIAENYRDAMFSPDSRTIAVRSIRGDTVSLTLIPLDGSAQTTINVDALSIVWSPDGSKIAVVTSPEAKSEMPLGIGEGVKVYSKDGKKLLEYNNFSFELRILEDTSGIVDALTWLPCK